MAQVVVGISNPFNYGKEIQEQTGNKTITVAEKFRRLMCLGHLHAWVVNCIGAPAAEFQTPFVDPRKDTNFHGTVSKCFTEFVSGDEQVITNPIINQVNGRYWKSIHREIYGKSKKAGPPATRKRKKPTARPRSSEPRSATQRKRRCVGQDDQPSREADDSSDGESERDSDDDSESDSGNEEFDVEGISSKRVNTAMAIFEYLVKWRGFSAAENTWEPLENLTGDFAEMLAEFEDEVVTAHTANRLETEMKDAKKASLVYAPSLLIVLV
jgi:hypothetical protein